LIWPQITRFAEVSKLRLHESKKFTRFRQIGLIEYYVDCPTPKNTSVKTEGFRFATCCQKVPFIKLRIMCNNINKDTKNFLGVCQAFKFEETWV
jgi:hypothetical protein